MTRVMSLHDAGHIKESAYLCYDICDEANRARARLIEYTASLCDHNDDPASVCVAALQPGAWSAGDSGAVHHPGGGCARLSCDLSACSLVAVEDGTPVPAGGVPFAGVPCDRGKLSDPELAGPAADARLCCPGVAVACLGHDPVFGPVYRLAIQSVLDDGGRHWTFFAGRGPLFSLP